MQFTHVRAGAIRFIMGKTNRDELKRVHSSESRYSLMEFERVFSDDAACLEYLVGKLSPDGIFCPNEGRITKHHRLRNRPAYSCQFCERHEYPLKGTIFQGSSTSLYIWFGPSTWWPALDPVFRQSSWTGRRGCPTLPRTGCSSRFGPCSARTMTASCRDRSRPTTPTLGGRDYWRKQGRPRAWVKRDGPDKVPVVEMAERGANGRKGRVSAKAVHNLSRRTIHPIIQAKVVPFTSASGR